MAQLKKPRYTIGRGTATPVNAGTHTPSAYEDGIAPSGGDKLLAQVKNPRLDDPSINYSGYIATLGNNPSAFQLHEQNAGFQPSGIPNVLQMIPGFGIGPGQRIGGQLKRAYDWIYIQAVNNGGILVLGTFWVEFFYNSTRVSSPIALQTQTAFATPAADQHSSAWGNSGTKFRIKFNELYFNLADDTPTGGSNGCSVIAWVGIDPANMEFLPPTR